MAEFRAGDRVVGRCAPYSTWRNGTIRAVSESKILQCPIYAVEFDAPITGGHECRDGGNSSCKPGHGWWLLAKGLAPAPAEILPGDIKLSFDNMFGGET